MPTGPGTSQQLERAKQAHIRITDEKTLDLQVKKLEGLKANWLLLCVELLEGKTQDRSALIQVRNGWSSSTKSIKNRVEKYLDKFNNKLDKNKKAEYRKRVDDCINFITQEKRVRHDCKRLGQYKPGPQKSLEEKRLDLLAELEGGRSLKQDIEWVKNVWSPRLSTIGDDRLGAEGYEEEGAKEPASNIEDEDEDDFMRWWMQSQKQLNEFDVDGLLNELDS